MQDVLIVAILALAFAVAAFFGGGGIGAIKKEGGKAVFGYFLKFAYFFTALFLIIAGVVCLFDKREIEKGVAMLVVGGVMMIPVIRGKYK